MQDEPYEVAVASFAQAAADHTTESGVRLVETAEAFKRALCAFLSEWQAEYDDGRSMQLPDRLRGVVELWLHSATLVEQARDLDSHRNLCFVLATAEAA